jgi:hypothetical protein
MLQRLANLSGLSSVEKEAIKVLIVKGIIKDTFQHFNDDDELSRTLKQTLCSQGKQLASSVPN